MTETYDLIVIGAGMAGVAAANKCAAAGWRVAIVDALPYGGTCALRGCDPKKILRRGAEIIEGARLLRGKGIADRGLAIDWADLMDHKRGFTDPVPDNLERQLAGNGADTFHGTATLAAEDHLAVDGTPYAFRHALVATGARPRPLDVPGAEHLIDSTDFLELPELPEHVMFVGGGFISFEFAHIAARAGSRPVIVDRGDRPLKRFDPDLVDLLVARSAEVGIDTHTQTSVAAIEQAGSGYRVTVDTPDGPDIIDADLVVHGAGRVPQLSQSDLDAAGVAHGERGISVAGHLQSTTNPRVFAAGDAADTPGMPLTPVAVFEGKVAASNMLKNTATTPDYDGVPTVVFTLPELARVGMLEADAEQTGIDVDAQAPDILALQEVGPPDALDHLRRALTHVLPHAELGDPDGRGIRVALLSTRPLEDPTKIRTLPEQVRPIQVRDPVWDNDATTDQMGRGSLAATVTVDGTPVTVVTAHLKSKLISYPRQAAIVTGTQWQPNDDGERLRYAGYAVNLRTAEAMTIRAHLDTILHNPADPDDGTGRATAVVFAGDLNDEPEAATTQIIKGSGLARPDRHDGYRMWNLAPLLPTGPNGEPRSTRVYRGRGELIDHIFASHRLVNPDNLPQAHTALTAAGPLPSVDDRPTDRRNEPGSDHAAVVATFTL